MATEYLWQRAVRRGIKSVRQEPRHGDFTLACALSAYAIERFRERIAQEEGVSGLELSRRIGWHQARLAEMERRIASTWKHLRVTIPE